MPVKPVGEMTRREYREYAGIVTERDIWADRETAKMDAANRWEERFASGQIDC